MTCNLSGTATSGGVALVGVKYIFTQTPAAVTLSGEIQYAVPLEATTGADGTWSVDLPDTDTGNPAGWSYAVQENFGENRNYFIEAPAGAHDLKDLAPVAVSYGVVVYPTLISAMQEWVTGDPDPTVDGTLTLPTGVRWVFNLASADSLPGWAPAGSLIFRH